MFGRKKKKTTELADPKDYQVVIEPFITEKAAFVGNDGRVIVLKVATKSTKLEIKEAVERIFKVGVDSVRTANYLGKFKRTVRGIGRKPKFKKAYVTLKEGQTIDFIEGF
jgi:large subunit ribosomal protein L23